MHGWIISKDNTQGCLVAFLSEEGYNNQHAAIEKIRTVTQEITNLSPGQIRIAGPSIDSVAIDDISNSSQRKLLPLFLLVCVAMLYFLLRSITAVFAIFVAAIFNEELSAALIYYSGSNMDSISLLSASLVFVLTISGGLHLINYYRDYLVEKGQKGAVINAMRKAFAPCFFACLTTVLGLYSLCISRVVPIQRFGLFATITLALGTLFYFLFIGIFLEQFPITAWISSSKRKNLLENGSDRNGLETSKGQGANGESVPETALSESERKRGLLWYFLLRNMWNWLPPFVIRHRKSLIALNAAAFIVLGWYLPKLETTVTFHGMFRNDAAVIQDYDYLENRFGGLVPVEIIVSIPYSSNEEASPFQALCLLNLIEQSLWEAEHVESSLSALNFLPYLPDPDSTGMRAVSTRSVFNKMVNSRLDILQEECLFDHRKLPVDEEMGLESAQRWRISLRVCAKSKIVYGPFLEKIEETVKEVIAGNQEACGLAEVTAIVTGGIPLVHKTQRQLLNDLTSSYLSAFGLILLTLIFYLKSIPAGIVAMIPNVFPSVLVFGAMALLDKPVDMGTMMTASVALGVSVDGTIHFLTWYRQALSKGMTQNDAIQLSYRECATAMVQASLICGCGMLVFTLSQFIPISRFAWMMAVLLLIALYGDLVLFPSLLASPLGFWFNPLITRKKRSLHDSMPEDNEGKEDNKEILRKSG